MDDAILLITATSGFAFFWLVTKLSIRWTQRKKRKLLKKALRRPLRPGEEDSLSTWLTVPTADLDQALQQLDENPFKEVEEAIDPLDVCERRPAHGNPSRK
jgi:hypothetical protein